MLARMEATFDASMPRPRAVAHLAAAAAAHPLERKIVVGPRRGVVREILQRLAREGSPWLGFEATTPLALARELVAARLVERGLTVIDEFRELELIDEAIAQTRAERGGEVLDAFTGGAGLRAALASSILTLRMASIEPPVLGRAGFRDRRKREALERVLTAYERRLAATRTIDAAGVVRHAADQLAARALQLPEARYYVLPGQDRRGVMGAMLGTLIELGAEVIDDDIVVGLDAPPAVTTAPADPIGSRGGGEAGATALAYVHAVEQLPATVGGQVELFAAGSISDEVREVLRRVVDRRLAWDEVEIVAVDPLAYGAAVDSLARRLDIPVTYAAGLPVSRTRPGRAVEAYLRWVRDDFAEDVLREAIQRGDIAPPDGGHGTPGPVLARRLRGLMIGRGRDRYAPALERGLRDALREPELDPGASPDEIAEARAAAGRAIDDLVAIVTPLLEATPPLPGRIDAGGEDVSPAALAHGLLAFLALVPTGPPPEPGQAPDVDAQTKARLVERLQRLSAVSLRPAPLDAAISIVAARLDTRVPAPGAAGASPWSSAGGCLHVSDLEHGGHSGRRATFILGLDASRFPGGAPHDTLLGDEERRRLASDAPFAPIPTSAERLHERRWQLARLLARLRGEVTLSYSAWEAAEARAVAPAAEMLQAFRLRERDPAADYEGMHGALELATAVPGRTGCLDRSDVWLRALAGTGVMLHGTDVVRAAFSGLDAGLRAAELRADPTFNAHHGRVRARPGLDGRDGDAIIFSAGRLETLGACPLRYLIRYVLAVQPPAQREWEADRWLTPLERGRLLHEVWRRTLLRFGPDRDVADAAFEAIAYDCLEETLRAEEQQRPAPGDAVREVETATLREDMRAFIRMTRSRGAPWRKLELRFGRGGEVASDPVRLELDRGVIRVAGAIDRIDQAADGLVVIDYKTGSAERFGRAHGVFDGGRRLQHALYGAVTRRVEGDIVRAEYHFPTQRGEAAVAAFEEKELRPARRIIAALLDTVAAGYFHPTSEVRDCEFCDYRETCRVRTGVRATESPLAEWAARSDAEELQTMRELRARGA